MTNRAPYDYNRVTKFTPQDNDMKDWHNKPKLETYVFIAPNPRFDPNSKYPSNRYAKAIEARIYGANTTYCSLWANARDNKTLTRGQGNAGGYGYHKTSAAVNDAACAAGFTFEKDFGGCGDTPIEHAIVAMAKKLGWNTGQVMVF